MLEEKLLEHENIKVLYNSILVKYITKYSNNTVLQAIQMALFNACNKEYLSPSAQRLVRPRLALLEKDARGRMITKLSSTKTNAIGIFAAGDVNSACYKRAVIAAGSDCIAALEMERFLCT